MTPRLEAIARYHRHFRRLSREAQKHPMGHPDADEALEGAGIAYRAMVVEAHPEKARERA